MQDHVEARGNEIVELESLWHAFIIGFTGKFRFIDVAKISTHDCCGLWRLLWSLVMFMDEHEVASSLHSVAKHSHIIESKFTSEGKVGSF